ncbi:MAG: putative DNA binding domain-containing protein [Armatimonadota bacterium]|nr:putative DNA binding domain-containing protein [Armatimonadota bacterium]
MTLEELQSQVALGEDSRRQFKRDVTNGGSLAGEMAAFANSEGGTVYLGVEDAGSLPGFAETAAVLETAAVWKARNQRELKRALKYRCEIDFTDDRDGCLFTAKVFRKEPVVPDRIEVGSEKSSEKILALLRANPELAARGIARMLGITQRAVEKRRGPSDRCGFRNRSGLGA